MSSATLLGAIHAAWAANAALLLALGEVYNDEPPEGTALPYAVLEELREPQEPDSFEGTKEYRGHFALLVYAVGTAAAEALAEQARAVLETAGAVAVAGRSTVRVTREDYRVRLDRTRSTDTRRVTEVRADYLAWTHG